MDDDKKVEFMAVNTHCFTGEPRDTIAIRLVENVLNSLLDSDFDRMRVLNYHVQKLNDALNKAAYAQPNLQGLEEVPNEPAR